MKDALSVQSRDAFNGRQLVDHARGQQNRAREEPLVSRIDFEPIGNGSCRTHPLAP
jgi:hypothetical protein